MWFVKGVDTLAAVGLCAEIGDFDRFARACRVECGDTEAGGYRAMIGVEYIAKVHREDGSLWAEVLDLPGCFASGESLDELREALEEAVLLYLSGDTDVEAGASVPAAERRLEVGEMRVSLPA